MSLNAYIWVTRHAPVPRPDSARLVLYALAEHAGPDGRGSFPGRSRLAAYLGGETQANRDKVKRALKILEQGGWITRGYHPAVADRPAHLRPIVWDLNLSLVRDNPVDDTELPGGSSDPSPGGNSDPSQGSAVTQPGVSSDPQTSTNHSNNRGGAPGRSDAPATTVPGTVSPSPDLPLIDYPDHCERHRRTPHPPACRACGDQKTANAQKRDAEQVAARKQRQLDSRRPAQHAPTRTRSNWRDYQDDDSRKDTAA